MLSKRGKANGKAKANKRPRAARANQKSKVNRPQKRFQGRPGQGGYSRPLGLGSTTQQIRAPVTVGSISRNNMFGWRFGAAAPHDEYAEGGLRISGVLPGSASTAVLTQDTALLGLFGTAGVSAVMVNPTGSPSTDTATALFSATGPLAVFAQFFRKFRFRKLTFETNSMIPTGGALGANGAATALGAPIVQISYEKDPFVANQNSGSYTIDSAVQTSCCTRFNAWANDVMCPLISERKNDGADTLFYVDAAGDSITASNSAILRQCCQGAVLATVNAVNTVADLPLAKVLIHFSVDLYGFTNIAESVEPRRKSGSVSEKKGDVKYLSAASVPDVDLTDFVSLTPRSNRLKVVTAVEPELQRQFPSAPPSVQGARASSKK